MLQAIREIGVIGITPAEISEAVMMVLDGATPETALEDIMVQTIEELVSKGAVQLRWGDIIEAGRAAGIDVDAKLTDLSNELLRENPELPVTAALIDAARRITAELNATIAGIDLRKGGDTRTSAASRPSKQTK